MTAKIICGTNRGCEDACMVREAGITCPSLYQYALDRLRERGIEQGPERREPLGVVLM